MISKEELYEMAVKATEMSYAPYSNFRVGAALLCEDGTVFTGCNIENASYGATICAERCAIAKAVSEGRRRFKMLAIAASGGEALPCGICRQVLAEFGKDILVITENSEHTVEELLPYSFDVEVLK